MVKKNGTRTVTTKKMVKKRKMTPEQKAAAVERLRIAREKRLKENPPKYKNIAKNVLALDDDDTFSLKNVRQWIKTQKGLLAAARQDKSESKLSSIRGYIRHCEDYIRHGDWIDMRYGEYQEGIIKDKCLHMAYDDDGQPKRSVGCWYPDIACEWTQEMDNEKRRKG